MKLLIMGPAGSGKGTISAEIIKEFSLQHISCGDEIRKEIKSGSDLGKEMKELSEKGILISDDKIIKLMTKATPKDNFIWDGFPRTLYQAQEIDKILSIDKAILLEVPEEEVIDRLTKRVQCKSCGRIFGRDFQEKTKGVCDSCSGELYQRPDDKEESIKKRLDIYKEETVPVIGFYKNKIIKINASL